MVREMLMIVRGPVGSKERKGEAALNHEPDASSCSRRMIGAGVRSLFIQAKPAPYSEDHFDIPISGCDSKTADDYRSLTRGERRAVRDRFRRPFEELLALFEPRQPADLVTGRT